MLKKDCKGFSAVEVLLVLVALVAIGMGGWYVKQSGNNSKATPSTTKPSKATDQEVSSFRGTLNQQDCTNAGIGCTEYVLITDDNSYSLGGSTADLMPFVGTKVIVTGQLKTASGRTILEVKSVKSISAERLPASLYKQFRCDRKTKEYLSTDKYCNDYDLYKKDHAAGVI